MSCYSVYGYMLNPQNILDAAKRCCVLANEHGSANDGVFDDAEDASNMCLALYAIYEASGMGDLHVCVENGSLVVKIPSTGFDSKILSRVFGKVSVWVVFTDVAGDDNGIDEKDLNTKISDFCQTYGRLWREFYPIFTEKMDP